MKVGYIVSRYPAVSHSFVQREVLALRERGWEVTTISVRRAAARELLTEQDRAEAASTEVIVALRPWRLAAAIAVPLLFSPGGFLGAMMTGWRLRRAGWRGALWALFYFVEALIVHGIAQRRGIGHFHAHFANVAADVAMIAAALPPGRRAEPAPGPGRRQTFSFTMHGPTEFADVAEHRLAEKARAAKFIICISDFARSQLMALLPPEQWSKLEVVHCGVDPAQFSGRAMRQERAGGRRSAEILTVARLVRVKGHAVLFRAVEELLLRGQEAALTLIGDGPLRRELEELAQVMGIGERVRFLGNVGQDVIREHYRDADVFVLPSFAEGVPVVLMEAMASSCPVIATWIAGIPELIEDGRNGLLVAPGRADLLAGAIERVLSSPSLAERMRRAGREKVRREFDIQDSARKIQALMKRWLGPASRAAGTAAVAARVREWTREGPQRKIVPALGVRRPA